MYSSYLSICMDGVGRTCVVRCRPINRMDTRDRHKRTIYRNDKVVVVVLSHCWCLKLIYLKLRRHIFLFFVSIVFNSYFIFSTCSPVFLVIIILMRCVRFVHILLSRWIMFCKYDVRERARDTERKIPNLWFYLSYDYVMAICFTFSDFILCWYKEIKWKRREQERDEWGKERRAHI